MSQDLSTDLAGSISYYAYKYRMLQDGLRTIYERLIEVDRLRSELGLEMDTLGDDNSWVDNMIQYGDKKLSDARSDSDIIEERVSHRSLGYLKAAGLIEISKLEQKKRKLIQDNPGLPKDLITALDKKISGYREWANKGIMATATPSNVLTYFAEESPAKSGYPRDQVALASAQVLKSESLTLESLHPEVFSKAHELFGNKHYRNAILDVYIRLVNRVQEISGRNDLDGTNLMQAVFSQKAPIIRISSDSDEQLGFMWLFSGAVMAIRNPKAHRVEAITDAQRSLEWLAFASVLHRVLDSYVEGQTSSTTDQD